MIEVHTSSRVDTSNMPHMVRCTPWMQSHESYLRHGVLLESPTPRWASRCMPQTLLKHWFEVRNMETPGPIDPPFSCFKGNGQHLPPVICHHDRVISVSTYPLWNGHPNLDLSFVWDHNYCFQIYLNWKKMERSLDMPFWTFP